MLIKVIVGFINLIIKFLGAVAESLIGILPTSPFLVFQNVNIPYLDTLNWVIPIDVMFSITVYWLSSIAIYYLVQVVLRWVKVIQ